MPGPGAYLIGSDTIDIKRRMFLEHKSQISWMKYNYGDDVDLTEAIEVQSRYRGWQIGVKYAEGFIPARYAFRMMSKRYLP